MRAAALLIGVALLSAAGASAARSRPDEALVAFASDRAENFPYPQIYVISAHGSRRKRISRDQAYGAPAWSPDGRAIAYPTRNEYEIVIVRADGRGRPRKLGIAGGYVDWSPDGKRLAIASEEGGPIYVKTLGGRLRRLTRREDYFPSWSPDGRLIAFVRHRDFAPELLFVIGADGRGLRRLASEPGGLPSWSPDSRRLALNQSGDVSVVELRNGKTKPITVGARSDVPVWSPDGNRIAFVQALGRARREIYVIRPDGTGLRRLTRNRIDEGELTWSPTGRRLAFARKTDVYTVDPVTRRIRRLSRTRCGEGANWLTWSPRGDLLAFGASSAGGSEIFTTDSSGAHVRQITRSCSGWKEHPAWSPTGEEIAFDNGLGGRGDIYLVRKDGSAARNLTRSSAWETDPSWSPDATHLVFASRVPDQPSELFTMRADGTEKQQITQGSWNASPSWSPRGDTIAFASNRDGAGIYRMNPDGTGVVRADLTGRERARLVAGRLAHRLRPRVQRLDDEGGRHGPRTPNQPRWIYPYAPVNSIDPDWRRLP